MQLLMFMIFGIGAVSAALMMVTNRKPVNAAMYLIVTMFCLAGLFVLLDAHLIAALQIIVYAGAIMVLFLFVIMLLNIEQKEGKTVLNRLLYQFLGILAVGSVFVIAAGMAKIQSGGLQATAGGVAEFGTVKSVGRLLFSEFLMPFEIASMLLLAAIVGAVILAKRRIDD
jgi:NADH-quinone oxidoreductase subunit J